MFDSIEFGDSYGTVQAKLMQSKLASTDLPETLFGRTGINGVFTTTRKIGGQDFQLFFTFESQALTEIQLQASNPASFAKAIRDLDAIRRELTILHGSPSQSGDLPSETQLPTDGAYLFETWHPKSGGTILCGLQKTEAGIGPVISLNAKHIELKKIEK